MKLIRLLIIFLLLSCRLAAQNDTTKVGEEVFHKVEVQAEFPAGLKALNNFLSHELHYPKDARKNGVEGSVFVEFVIDVTGEVEQKSVRVIKGLYPSCDNESMRVVKLFPKWSPARDKGVPVRCRFVLPINFKRK